MLLPSTTEEKIKPPATDAFKSRIMIIKSPVTIKNANPAISKSS